MADAAQQQNQVPEGKQPPFFAPSEPKSPKEEYKEMEAKKERDLVDSVLKTISPEEMDTAISHLEAPPALETSPAYQAKKAQDAQNQQAEEAMVEIPPPLETSPAYLAQQAKKATLEKYHNIEKMSKEERESAISALTENEMRLILLELEEERTREHASVLEGDEEKISGIA